MATEAKDEQKQQVSPAIGSASVVMMTPAIALPVLEEHIPLYEEALRYRKLPQPAIGLLTKVIKDGIDQGIPLENLAEFFYLRGHAYWRLSDTVAGNPPEQEYLAQARADWLQALDMGSPQLRFLIQPFGAGTGLMRSLQERTRLAECRQQLKKKPDDVALLLEIAELEFVRDEHGQAVNYLERAAKLPSTQLQEIQRLRIRAWVYIEEGEFNNARSLIKAAQKMLGKKESKASNQEEQEEISREQVLISFAAYESFLSRNQNFYALERQLGEFQNILQYYAAALARSQASLSLSIAKKNLDKILGSKSQEDMVSECQGYLRWWKIAQVELFKGRHNPYCQQQWTTSIQELISVLRTIPGFSTILFDTDNGRFPLSEVFDGTPYEVVGRSSVNSLTDLLLRFSYGYCENPSLWLMLAEALQDEQGDREEIRQCYQRALYALKISGPSVYGSRRRETTIKALVGLDRAKEARQVVAAWMEERPLENAQSDDLTLFFGQHWRLALGTPSVAPADSKKVKAVHEEVQITLTSKNFSSIVHALMVTNLPDVLMTLVLSYLLETNAKLDPIALPAKKSAEIKSASDNAVLDLALNASLDAIRLDLAPGASLEIKCKPILPYAIPCNHSIYKLLADEVKRSHPFAAEQEKLGQAVDKCLQALPAPTSSWGRVFSDASKPERVALQQFLQQAKQTRGPLEMARLIITTQQNKHPHENFTALLSKLLQSMLQLGLAQQKQRLCEALTTRLRTLCLVEAQSIFPDDFSLDKLIEACNSAEDFPGFKVILQSESNRIVALSPLTTTKARQRYRDIIEDNLYIINQWIDKAVKDSRIEKPPTPSEPSKPSHPP